MNNNLLTQPLIALHTKNINASKDVEFQKMYTNNYTKLSVIEEKLLENEGAKNELELLKDFSSTISDLKLKIDFESLESNVILQKYQELEKVKKKLVEQEIDTNKDYSGILKDLQKNGININYLSKEELEPYKDSIKAELLIEWLKIKSEIQQFESLKASQIEGFIKPKFHLWGSLSGRVISHSPSTQNFPKCYKDYILPLNDGESIYELDIKSAEVIGIAYLSEEHQIFDLLSNGKDIYTYIFSRIFNKKEDEVSAENRDLTKKIVNGINLGLGVERLKNLINDSGIANREITEIEAKVIRDKYYGLFPKINDYLSMIKKDNKVTTNLGLEKEVEPSYKHMSFPAQNIIATTIKTIVASLCDYKERIINIVHDSLWISANETDLKVIKNCMEEICSQLLPDEYLNKEIELIKVTKLGGKLNEFI